MSTAWLVDTFGHHPQMPQLLKKAGYTSFWFSRGVTGVDHPSEFLWEGIDGTQIPAFWLPHSYGMMYGSPKELPAFRDFVKGRFAMLTPNSRGPDRVGPAGVDVCEPEEHLVALIEAFNTQPDAPFAMRLAVPTDFEAVAAQRAERPVFKGELNPIFQGTYSSRIELKQRMRVMERLLTAAEKLGVLSAWLGTPADDRDTWRAWEPVLFNETHDLSSGVMTDHVYEDTVRGYDYSRRLADELIEARWGALAAKIDTRGAGVPVVVFNTLGWTRSDVAETDLAFVEGEAAKGVALADPEGHAVPIQILEASRYADGGLRTAKVAFLAREVPALGFGTYRATPTPDAGAAESKPTGGNTLENDTCRLTVDLATGAMTGLTVKQKDGDWEAVDGVANVVARATDRGDLWELYKGLDGGSKVAMTTKQAVPKRGEAKFSDESKGEPGVVRSGPVFSEFRVSHPFENGSFATTVRVVAGLRRVEFLTALVNNEKFVRYQALFPTTIQGGKTVHEIPFGAVERPGGVEFPAQTWADYGDGKRGVALLNVGLPGNLATDGTLMVSLLRAHTLGAYGFGGGYEPGMSSESGMQLGKERTMRYAVVPHAGDWREAGITREGAEFNNPLICRKVASHPGILPSRWGFLEVSAPNVAVSAMKPGPGETVVVRVYETTGKPAKAVTLATRARTVSAHEVDLMESEVREVDAKEGRLRFDLSPFEIKTFRLKLDAARAAP